MYKSKILLFSTNLFIGYVGMVLTTKTDATIIALVKDGRSKRYAARSLGMPETTVRKAVQ